MTTEVPSTEADQKEEEEKEPTKSDLKKAHKDLTYKRRSKYHHGLMKNAVELWYTRKRLVRLLFQLTVFCLLHVWVVVLSL